MGGVKALCESPDNCPGHITSGPADEVLETLLDAIDTDDLHNWEIAIYFRRAASPRGDDIEQ